MIKLKSRIAEQKLSHAAAAERLDVPQSKIGDLMQGKIERFTVDALVNMLIRIGIGVDVVFKDAA